MKNMRRVLSLFALVALLLCLAGCGKKTVYTLRVEDIGDYEVIGAPNNVVNYSANGNDIRVTVDRDGEYAFTVKDAEGAEYAFTFIRKGGETSVEAQEGINVSVTGE